MQALVRDVAELRLASQMIEDPRASAVGPTASMVVDFRLDDTALGAVMNKDRIQLQNVVVSLMEATQLERAASNAAAERERIRTLDTPKAPQ